MCKRVDGVEICVALTVTDEEEIEDNAEQVP